MAVAPDTDPPTRTRRRPGARALSVSAIAAGVAVFVVTSLVAPLAGADTTARRTAHADRPATPGELKGVLQTAAASSTPAAPPAARIPASSTSVLTKHSKSTTTRKAPVDTTVISGLAANGIPSVALNAYRVAAARVDNDDPSCGIDWSLLAGIGREESDHGQFGGAVLHSDGVSTPAIIGPALNGKGNQFIPAPPDGLALDGDAKYAHALGPMQFIPSTWAIYGTDADGDGHANIFDINDASLATARYLCAAGGDLSTQAGRVRAVFAYNHTDVYVAQVLALAHAYKTGTPITGLPNGNTTGSLPGLGHAGKIPPANPGAPTATQKTKARQRAKGRTGASPAPLKLGGGTSSSSGSAPRTSASTSPSASRTPSRTHSPKPTKTKTSSPHPSGSKSSAPTSPSPTPSGVPSMCVLGICGP